MNESISLNSETESTVDSILVFSLESSDEQVHLQLIQGNDILPVQKEYNDKTGYNSRGIVGKLGYTQIE